MVCWDDRQFRLLALQAHRVVDMTGPELIDILTTFSGELSRIISFACGSLTAMAFVLASTMRL